MYQLEVKRWLVEHDFHPNLGWEVWVDINAMERAKGGVHPADKAGKALVALGVTTGAHPEFGRADIVAEHAEKGLFIIEAEGDSSRHQG